MSTRTTTMGRPKWHPTPPPPPKIINLPKQTRRKQPGNVVIKPPLEVVYNYRGKLENLFGEEREFSRTMLIVLLNLSERRERVAEECELESSGGGVVDGFMEIEKPHYFFPSGGGGIDDDPDYGLYQFFDIDMVTVQRYESLKDFLATSPKPSTIFSMMWNRRENWQEIPIKDPLVQHAAWAYLLPGSPPASEGNDRKLTDGCWVFLVI